MTTSSTETILRFAGDYPLPGVIVGALTLATAMWFLYQREAGWHSGRWKWLPGGLRSAAVFVLVLALSGPVLRRETTRRELGRVVLAVDASASMKLEDEAAGGAGKGKAGAASRYARAESMLLSGAAPLLGKLKETQDVELVLLRGAQVQRLWWHRQEGRDTPGAMPAAFDVLADAPTSDLDQTLREALGPLTAGTALVLFSDGQHNGPGSPEEFAGAMRQANVPIFTVGFGTEVPPADLSIVNVQTGESVFLEENLSGRVTVGDSMPPNTPATVRVVSGGKTLWEQNFRAEGRGERRFDFSIPVKNLPPAPPGERDETLRMITVQVAAQGEGAGAEKTRSNNSRDVALHLLTQKRKVLILDGRPRWEVRYVHNHFDRDERWQASLVLDNYAERAEESALRRDFPKSREELMRYDLVLLGDVAPTRLSATQLEWLTEFVEKRGGGIIMLDGMRGHLRNWAGGKTAALPPVSWAGGQGRDAQARRSALRLTNDGERINALRLSDSPSANVDLWPTLPEVSWAAMVRPQPGATVLAELIPADAGGFGANGAAAVVFRPVGAGAVLYLASDDLWRWRYQVGDLYHQRLWMQLAAWIAAPAFQAESQRVAIGTDRLRYVPGEQSEIRVRLRNQAGELLSGAAPRAHLLLEGREVATLQLEPDPTHFGVYRALTPPLRTGAYEIAVSEGGTAPKGELRLSLRVTDPGSPELANLTMNRPLLETMAAASGGRFLREERAAAELPNILQAVDRKQTTVSETQLWSSWWWFLAVIGLLTAEWLMRKRMRLV